MKNVIFVFVDGLGLGDDDPEVNPLARFDLPSFNRLTAGRELTASAAPYVNEENCFIHIDANLGMEGLPQSGTGQASIFTGINCAQLAGRHYGPYPHSTSSEVIQQQNIFRQIEASGVASIDEMAFANTYPRRFFSYVSKTNRWTVTTKCCMAAGILIRTTDDLAAGAGVAADITGDGLARIADEVVPVSIGEAADNLVSLAGGMAFTLFEYFHTDKAGHSQSFDRAHVRLTALDQFLGEVMDRIDKSRTVLVITSDHGNIEDLSTRSHTRNPVPFIAHGLEAGRFAGVSDLAGIAGAVVDWYRATPSRSN